MRDGFRPSESKLAWLGEGVYFFESDPSHAVRWAQRWHKADPVVLEVSLALNDPGLDLLRIEARRLFKELATELLRERPEAFRELEYCDATVIEYVKSVMPVLRWIRALVLVGDKEYRSGTKDGFTMKSIELPGDARVRTIRNAVVVISVLDTSVIRSSRNYDVVPD
jgi:hypothetical protein